MAVRFVVVEARRPDAAPPSSFTASALTHPRRRRLPSSSATSRGVDGGSRVARAVPRLTPPPLRTRRPRAQAAEVEETIKRISSHKGVQGILVANFEGVALKSTLPPALAAQYAGLFSTLVAKARSTVRAIDADNDLVFLRVRTKKHEVMVAPDREFILVVVQDVNVEGAGGH